MDEVWFFFLVKGYWLFVFVFYCGGDGWFVGGGGGSLVNYC